MTGRTIPYPASLLARIPGVVADRLRPACVRGDRCTVAHCIRDLRRRGLRVAAREASEWAHWIGCARPPTLALCPACIGSIGGAHGGPDAPYREAKPGEPCGAADCQGAPGEAEDPALDIEEPDGRTMRERIGGES